MRRIILGRFFWSDALAVSGLVVALAYALLSAAPPTERTFEAALAPNTIWESWTVDVPQVVGCTSVEIDLMLTASGDLGFENRLEPLFYKPRARLHSREVVTVQAPGATGLILHREPYALIVDTPGVAPFFDGVTDFDGLSGTRAEWSVESHGDATGVDPDMFDGTGVVTLTVVAPVSNTRTYVYGTFDYRIDYEVTVGGVLRVRYGT